MNIKKLTLLFTIISIATFSQEKNTIKEQFENVYRTSTTYQVYKVISKDNYENLKDNVLDSLTKAKEFINEKQTSLQIEKDRIDKLNEKLEKTEAQLERVTLKENSILFLGTPISKLTYNLIMWLLVIALSVMLGYFVFKFFRSHVLTKQAEDNLETVELEFEQHRKKSLVREQKLRRELQDEINKQKNN